MFIKTKAGEFEIIETKSRLDIGIIHAFLSKTYWAENIDVEIVKTSIENSRCYGVFTSENAQIGFARMITDNATFAYLGDVFILEEFRGLGLSKALMDFILSDPCYSKMRRLLLFTKDAHGLYEKAGFKTGADASRIMQIHRPDIYRV